MDGFRDSSPSSINVSMLVITGVSGGEGIIQLCTVHGAAPGYATAGL